MLTVHTSLNKMSFRIVLTLAVPPVYPLHWTKNSCSDVSGTERDWAVTGKLLLAISCMYTGWEGFSTFHSTFPPYLFLTMLGMMHFSGEGKESWPGVLVLASGKEMCQFALPEVGFQSPGCVALCIWLMASLMDMLVPPQHHLIALILGSSRCGAALQGSLPAGAQGCSSPAAGRGCALATLRTFRTNR